MVIIIWCEVYIICHDEIKINSKWLDRLIHFEKDEGASMWKNLVVVIHICPSREACEVLEDPCLKNGFDEILVTT